MICKQLGYNYANDATGWYFGSVPDDFSYSYVSCSGYEWKLEYCDLIDGSPFDSCSVNNGAKVRCSYYDEHDDHDVDVDANAERESILMLP